MPPGYRESTFRASTKSEKRAEARLHIIVLPINPSGHLHHSLHYVSFVQMGARSFCSTSHLRPSAACWLSCTYRGLFKRVLGRWHAGTLRRFSVQTGVIMLEYINQLRAKGHTIVNAAVEGAVLRTSPHHDEKPLLVATLGLLPAALSHGNRLRFAAPFCHCHCGRPDFRPAIEHRSLTDVLCLDRQGRRPPPGAGGGS